MIPDLIQKAVFASIPRSVSVGETVYTVEVQEVGQARIDTMLQKADIAAEVVFFGETEDTEKSPVNKNMGVRYNEAAHTQEQDTGFYEECTVSITVYVPRDETKDVAAILKAYLNRLSILWYLRDLPQIVDVIGCTVSPDLTFTETDTLKRAADIQIRYQVGYTETVGCIETVEDPELSIL